MKTGDTVKVNIGYKVIEGVVVRYDGGKYIIVKHDNFAGESFNINQIIKSDD